MGDIKCDTCERVAVHVDVHESGGSRWRCCGTSHGDRCCQASSHGFTTEPLPAAPAPTPAPAKPDLCLNCFTPLNPDTGECFGVNVTCEPIAPTPAPTPDPHPITCATCDELPAAPAAHFDVRDADGRREPCCGGIDCCGLTAGYARDWRTEPLAPTPDPRDAEIERLRKQVAAYEAAVEAARRIIVDDMQKMLLDASEEGVKLDDATDGAGRAFDESVRVVQGLNEASRGGTSALSAALAAERTRTVDDVKARVEGLDTHTLNQDDDSAPLYLLLSDVLAAIEAAREGA